MLDYEKNLQQPVAQGSRRKRIDRIAPPDKVLYRGGCFSAPKDRIIRRDEDDCFMFRERYEIGDRRTHRFKVFASRTEATWGFVYTALQEIEDEYIDRFKKKGRAANILILTGTHGEKNGDIGTEDRRLIDPRFVEEDRLAVRDFRESEEMSGYANIKIIDARRSIRMGSLTTETVNNIIEQGIYKGRRYHFIILAFCYSLARYNRVNRPDIAARDRLSPEGGEQIFN